MFKTYRKRLILVVLSLIPVLGVHLALISRLLNVSYFWPIDGRNLDGYLVSASYLLITFSLLMILSEIFINKIHPINEPSKVHTDSLEFENEGLNQLTNEKLESNYKILKKYDKTDKVEPNISYNLEKEDVDLSVEFDMTNEDSIVENVKKALLDEPEPFDENDKKQSIKNDESLDAEIDKIQNNEEIQKEESYKNIEEINEELKLGESMHNSLLETINVQTTSNKNLSGFHRSNNELLKNSELISTLNEYETLVRDLRLKVMKRKSGSEDRIIDP